MRTTILLDHEETPAGRVVRALLRLEGDVPTSATRVPLNLSLVLDRSGSMGGGKLVAAREAAALLVRGLALEDVVSVVAYDDEVSVISEPVSGTGGADVPARIERIETGGSTNLSGGWLRGRELVQSRLAAGGVNRVVLLTDGQANVGLTRHDQLVGMCRAGREHGVSTTTIGFGQDYDEVLLRDMADAGGGNAYYIERSDQAAAIFGDELQGLLGLGAQNVRVEVRPAAAVTLAAVHHEYPRTTAADGALRLDLGDLYAREPRSLLCEFLVTADAGQATSLPVATLVVTADVVVAEGIEHRRVELPITVSPADGPRVDADIQRELLLLEAARARREALEAERAGEYERGRAHLVAAHTRLSAFAAGDPQLGEEAEDLALSATLYEAREVVEADRKYLRHRAYNVTTGRAAKSELIRRTRRQAPDPDAQAQPRPLQDLDVPTMPPPASDPS